MNHEGYRDPTADIAINRRPKAPEKVVELIYLMKKLADICGYEVEGRIWLRDKKTGKEWR